MKKITLSDEQNDMVAHMERHAKCKIIAATGVGKTFTQAEVFAREIKRCNLRKGKSIIVVKAGRRLLVDQLACEVAEYLLGNHDLKRNEHYQAIIVHSGEGVVKGKGGKKKYNSADDQMAEEARKQRLQDLEEALTYNEQDQLKDLYPETHSGRYEILEMVQKRDLPIILFTTYHSNEKVGGIINLIREEVEIDMNDEAHFLTFGVDEDVDDRDKRTLNGYNLKWNELFRPGKEIYVPRRQYFHTATERTSTGDPRQHPDQVSDGIGMDNPKRFGVNRDKFLLTPKEAVGLRSILPCKPYRIKGADGRLYDQSEEQSSPDQFIERALDMMEEDKDCSRTSLLVTLNGTLQCARLYGMDENSTDDPYADGSKPEWIERMEEKYKGIKILSLFSKPNFIRCNGEKISRKKFMRKLKKYGNSDCKLLLLHHDTLAEGIDVPGLHGVLFLRSVDVAKNIQTIGRVLRVDKNDRDQLLEEGKETQLKNIPEELWNKRKKKQGYAFWPLCSDASLDETFKDRFKAVYLDGIALVGRTKSPSEKINGRNRDPEPPVVEGEEDAVSLNDEDLRLKTEEVLFEATYRQYEDENFQKIAQLAEAVRGYTVSENKNPHRNWENLVGSRFKFKDCWISVKSTKKYVDENTGDVWDSLNKAINKATEAKYGKASSLSVWTDMKNESGRTPDDVCKEAYYGTFH